MSYKLHVGELKPIQWFPNLPAPAPQPASPVNLTGLTVLMVWEDAEGGAHSTTMTVASGGASASYTTQAGDLPCEGIYKFQWFVYQTLITAAPLMESDIDLVTVGNALAITELNII